MALTESQQAEMEVELAEDSDLENENNEVTIKSQAIGSQAIGSQAVGALAVGALALGAVAIGFLVIGRLMNCLQKILKG